MSELEKLLVGAATVGIVIYLVGPAGFWELTKAAAEWLLVVLLLIWGLYGLVLPCRQKQTGGTDMSANGFREDELVHRRVKVGDQWQARTFPIFGGRLRLAHEGNKTLSLQTEMVSWDGEYAVFKCVATTEKGQFVGFGSANAQRDSRLSESLIELAETRSCARALRFAGYGLEYTSAEEVSHVDGSEAPKKERKANKDPKPIFPDTDSNGKPEGNSSKKSAGNGGAPKATQAQCRALFALTRKAGFAQEDIDQMLSPMSVAVFDDLAREDASRLISDLQTQVAA